jgi:phosphoribosylformimino-5-aminoimidazole carboxamide ribotide isomerase
VAWYEASRSSRLHEHRSERDKLGGLQVGGGITEANAQEWLDAGASKVIVTSYLFPEGKFALERLRSLSNAVGKERLVVDVR